MAPPPLNLTAAQVAPMLRPSPAVAGALSTSAAVQFQSRPGWEIRPAARSGRHIKHAAAGRLHAAGRAPARRL